MGSCPFIKTDKLTVSFAALRPQSAYRRLLRFARTLLDRLRSRSAYQGRSSRLRFSAREGNN